MSGEVTLSVARLLRVELAEAMDVEAFVESVYDVFEEPSSSRPSAMLRGARRG